MRGYKDRIIIATAIIMLMFVGLAGYLAGVSKARSTTPRSWSAEARR